MKEKAHRWFHNLIAAAITGGANAGLAALGIVGADAIGINVPTLDARQLAAVFRVRAVVGLLAYLKQSPLPPESGDTQFVSKDNL